MVTLIMVREILFTLLIVLSIFGVITTTVLMYTGRNKIDAEMDKLIANAPDAKSMTDDFYNRLLANANDDKPIILNVSQERLIERVADEIERRRGL